MIAAAADPAEWDETPSHRSWYVRPEGAVWGILGVGVALSLLSPNPLLTAGALLVLPVLITLLWRRGEMPVLLFAVAFQWVQVSAKVFHANLLGVDVVQIAVTATVERAIWMGLLALVVLALGMRLALRGAGAPRGPEAEAEATYIPLSRALSFYVVTALVGLAANGAMWIVPGVAQIAYAVEGIKWIGFFVLGYVVLSQREGYLFLAAATAFEFVQGLGFFSEFKTVVFVLGLAVFTVFSRLSGRTVGIGLAGVAALLVLGSAWTAVKMEYRAFLNQGSGMQETRVSRDEQFDALGDLVGTLTWADLQDSLDPLLARVAYVDFFGVVMDYVPTVVPHQDGQVWGAAVQNLVPRLLYPSKPVLDSDSEHTMQFTGMNMAGAESGTSISLGYVADSYIDFGPVGMYGVIFVIGLLWGGVYRYFVTRSGSALLGFGFAMAALLFTYQYEIAAVKLLAGVVVKFLVLAVLLRFLEGPMREWLRITEWDLNEAPGEAPEAPAEAHA
jgi:hypothetical protein